MAMLACSLLAVTISVVLLLQTGCTDARNFRFDVQSGHFLLDNKTFTFLAGCMHYYRVPRPYWRHRMKLMRAAGVTVLQTPVEWSSHEKVPGLYDFKEENDIVEFLNIAQQEDLYVILRPGPFIGAERDFGGLPAWLLWEHPDIEPRTNHDSYLYRAELYLKNVFRHVTPLLIANNGPVIMVEVELETRHHLSELLKIYERHLGKDVVTLVVNSCKGRSNPPAGLLSYNSPLFALTNDWKKDTRTLNYDVGPYTEVELGWAPLWGLTWRRVHLTTLLQRVLAPQQNTLLTMFHGGTNFGFSAGALYLPDVGRYVPHTTTYDSDAPLGEAARVDDKYKAVRDVIMKYQTNPLPLPNNTISSTSYGDLELRGTACLLETHSLARTVVTSSYPLTFEELRQGSGIVIYETELQRDYGNPYLKLPNLRDRAQVYLDRQMIGVVSRSDWIGGLQLQDVRRGTVLQVVVENQGRVYPNPSNRHQMYYKGLTYPFNEVMLGGMALHNWTMYGFPLDNSEAIHNFVHSLPARGHRWHFCTPTLYKTKFQLPQGTKEPLDTHVNMQGWGKGVVWINGRNLGRYWPGVGPQVTLYLPGCYLLPHPGVNKLVVLELERAREGLNITLQGEPVIYDVLESNRNVTVAFCMLCTVVLAMLCATTRSSRRHV